MTNILPMQRKPKSWREKYQHWRDEKKKADKPRGATRNRPRGDEPPPSAA